MQRLHALVGDEVALRRARIEHFVSPSFVVGNAGHLFPRTWTSSIESVSRKGSLHPLRVLREDHREYGNLESLKRVAANKVFGKSTEDGLHCRIYKHGALEIRTTQDIDGEEI